MATGRQLSAEEIAIFRDCFNEYDQDRGGNISAEEFGRVMRKTNPSITDDEVAKIIKEVDLDGDGTINFDEFITMMTGQPYKSPEPAAAAVTTTTTEEETKTEGTPPGTTAALKSPTSAGAGAVRGLSTMSARLQRQRLANQVYKDAWAATDPTLKASLSRDELAAVAARAGLSVTGADLEELVDPAEGEGARITYERFLDFAKRQEVDDILSGYEEE
ncbi:EF-hand [Cryphonectria parasitica EP155]|uniref:Calmodulin n=1 Tax=Cryphonectria parasitica (strain ATCC 38755 / EP155) TaxID=660469 RepID=A0A9P5CN85_CRYP1|nr:EF-hand [Cryphonectria parasitica EP155]KAF3765184.1 EF-hand [Cryphonectria parasitica EP155]